MSKNPKEVFVGNLSFFCIYSDLVELFSPYACVLNASVRLNHNRTKSLMYGFVRFSQIQEAAEIARLFNGQMFMGRELRVTHISLGNSPLSTPRSIGHGSPLSTPRSIGQESAQRPHVSVHLSISAPKNVKHAPTETLLRKAFVVFGFIHDIVLREYAFNPKADQFQGFGFMTFVNEKSAFSLAASNTPFFAEGFTFVASLSHSATC